MRNARDLHVSAISIIEMIYLVGRRKVPPTALQRLRQALIIPDAGISVAPVDASVANALEKIPRSVVPDMPDRLSAQPLYISACHSSRATGACNLPEFKPSGNQNARCSNI